MFETNLVGQTLGAYTIISKIGQGGMAVVYKAYESALDRHVAIKILPPSLALETGFSARFEREAKAIAKLDHPNILPVYSYGQQYDFSYLVMRYVQAGTLKERMGRPLELTYIVEIIRQVGDALQYAHDSGIVHRDIKPSNILMSNEHWALLTDFGLAKMMASAASLTGTGVGVGTPAYMSPEQAQGLEVDGRTDIYSLGVMLYEMVIGKVPYEAETPMAVVLKHISAPLPLPSQAKPDLPEAIENVILKALAKRPADRFQNVVDFTKALDAAILSSTTSKLRDVLLPEPVGLVTPPVTLGQGETHLIDVAELDEIQSVDEPTIFSTPQQPQQSAVDSSAAVVQELPKESLHPIPNDFTVETDKLPIETPEVHRRRVSPWVWRMGTAFVVVLLIIIAFAWGFGNIPATGVNASPPPPTLSLPTATASPTPRPSLILRFTTTSDWASVSFSGAVIKSSQRTSVSGNPSNANREGQTIRLNQNINLAFMGRQISSTSELFLSDLKLVKNLGLSLEAGCLGYTEVEISNAVVDPPVVVFRQIISNCKIGSFPVPIELLTTNTPIAIQRKGPPEPAFPTIADTDESKLILVCPDSQPPNQQLCMIKAHSVQLVKLTKDFKYAELWQPAWSGDGAKIYYIAQPTPNSAWQLFVMNTDGTGREMLLNTATISWSPDGQTIAYSNDCQVLRFMKPDGTERSFMNTPGVRCMQGLVWSPDGTQLAFADLFNFDTKPPSVWVINRDGTNLRHIYQFDTKLIAFNNLAWSPDGKLVGVWYVVKQGDNQLGLLLDPAGTAEPQPIDWPMPIWWMPSFWPQWGLVPKSP